MQEPFFFSLLLSRLELSDTKVYKLSLRARLETAAHFCEVVVLKLRTVPLPPGARTTKGEEKVQEPHGERRFSGRFGPLPPGGKGGARRLGAAAASKGR